MTKICIICEEPYQLLPNHPGKATHCPDCTHETATRYMACVSWDGKNHGSIEITKDTQYATAFNQAQKRGGYGVGRSLVERKAPQAAPTQSKLVSAQNVQFATKTTTAAVGGISEHYKRH